jgi:hypothetical protein
MRPDREGENAMHYKVRVIVENCNTGVFREAERTVTLNVGNYDERHPTARGQAKPIDVAQQERLVHWAIREAAEEAVGRRV